MTATEITRAGYLYKNTRIDPSLLTSYGKHAMNYFAGFYASGTQNPKVTNWG